jgi:outer membrane protein assembly factor BamB
MLRRTLTLLSLLSFAALTSGVQAEDWPQWGGLQRDHVWRETGIVKTLPKGLLPRVWSTPLGEGYSGPAVAKGKVYITDRIREKRTERVLCLDAETGKIVWTHEYPAQYTVSYPAGPRSTPVVDAGRVYAIGAMGHMFCFDADKGTVLWQRDFVKEFGTKIPIWGLVASPLVDGDQLITLVGGENSLVVAFDKKTGKELWRSLNDEQVGYCPPVIFEFDGVRQLIVWHQQALSSLNPKNGEVYWQIPFRVRAALCIGTPRRVGNRLFVTAFYNGPLMVEVSGKTTKVAWRGKSDSEVKTDGLHSIISTPWMNKTHIYGICSYGQLRCLDAKTGARLWETFDATGKGRWWNAFIIPHEDRYFIHNEQGDLIIANLTPQGYKEISRAKLVEPTRPVQRRQTIWSHPAFAMKSVFARNDKEIVRVDLSAK